MMLIPRRRNMDFFDDMFRDPFFDREEKHIMRTDVKEKGDKYIIDMNLPGYDKEDIKVEIENGYLTVKAEVDTTNESGDEDNYVCRERFIGSCSRSFYVGEDVKEENIKAKFKNGTLTLEVPKKDEKETIPEKKYIQID